MHVRNVVVALTLVLIGAGVGLGNPVDSLNIIITPSGANTYTGYFQINNAADSYSGAWTSFSPSQGSWDSLNTEPGTADAGGNSANPLWVGNTEDFAMTSVSNANTSFTNSTSWEAASGNTTGSSEGALVLTKSGTSSTSTVLNALVLDTGGGGIYVYNAPTTVDTSVTTPVTQYGYTGNGTTSYNPGAGTPISELGSAGGSGLEGDLQFNGGFKGTGNGTNIGVGQQGTYTDPRAGEGTFTGYVYSSDTIDTGDPMELRETTASGTFLGYVSPTIYFEETAVGLPNTAATMLALLGLVGAVGYMRSNKRGLPVA